MKRKIKAGTTSHIEPIRVYDSSSTTGGYLGSLVYNTSGLTGKYRREGDANWTAINGGTLVTATAGTFASGGWAVPGGTGPTGSYEVHIPDAALASGAKWVEIEYYGATNMLPVAMFFELDAVDYQTAVASATDLATLTTYVDTEVAAIKAKTDNLPTDPADASVIAGRFDTVDGSLTTINSYIDTEIATILAAVDTEIAAIKAKTDNLPTDPADASDISAALTAIDDFVDTEVAAIKAVTDKLDTALAQSGLVWQFTTNALENAPSASGSGDWTADQKAAILAILGVPGSGSTPTNPSAGVLYNIKAKTDLITAGSVTTSAPVTATGKVNPIVIGDDYLSANGRAFTWTITAPTGFVVGTSTCKFGGLGLNSAADTWNITGTVTDAGSGSWTLSFDMTKTISGALSEGLYKWSVEVASAEGVEHTVMRWGSEVEVVSKQT